jgi:histidine triad (HIT) family protein
MTDCIFCRIVSGDIPATIVDRTEEAVAFRDLDPKAPTHILVIPVKHVAAARDAKGDDGARLLGHLVQFATRVAQAEGLDAGGYRLVSNTGPDAGQSVPHLHLHLLGGRHMTWPPG